MLTVTYDKEEEKYKVKGTFKLGIAGTYENKSFDDEVITIDEDILENIRERDEDSVGPLLPFIKSDEPEEIAKGLEEYYNQFEKRAAENEKQINDCILYNLFEDMEGCGYPFWEVDGLVDKKFLNSHDEDELDELIYGDSDEDISSLSDHFEDSPNNGTVKKPDVEARIRELYPMFNLDKFVNTLKPEYLHLNGRFISFQFSDAYDGELACGAYDVLDENFTFSDWHNH